MQGASRFPTLEGEGGVQGGQGAGLLVTKFLGCCIMVHRNISLVKICDATYSSILIASYVAIDIILEVQTLGY